MLISSLLSLVTCFLFWTIRYFHDTSLLELFQKVNPTNIINYLSEKELYDKLLLRAELKLNMFFLSLNGIK